MSAEEREAFCQEMHVQPFDRDQLIRRIMHASGQMLFFTAGEKEVRTWLIRQGGTALEAAGGIHTDLARGFIRAETMNVADHRAPRQRARDQGRRPRAAGAEGLRDSGRRHHQHQAQLA